MENKNMFERYAALLQEKRYRELRELLAEENEVDLAEFIEGLTQEQAVLAFRMLPKGLAAEVFSNLPPEVQQNIVTSVTDQELSEIVEDLFLDDAVDMLEELPANVVKRVLKQARPETRRLINQFLQYPENSVGSIMTAEFVDLKKDTTAGEAIQRIRKVGEDCEAIYTCYVTDSQRVLKGVITLRELLLADENQPVGENMETDIVTVQTTDDRELAVSQMMHYDFLTLPVVDRENRLVGVVTVDDAMDVMEEEATEDIEKMAAITPSEHPYLRAKTLEIWKQRIPWLLLLMVSATFTGMIISGFEQALAAQAALIAFIPMLMDTGGNCGSQASVTVIRGMSLGEIELSDVLRVMWKEIRVSLMCGGVLGAVAFAKIMLIDGLLMGNPGITVPVAAVVCATLVCTVVLAKLVGCTLPMAAKKLGFDPAVMASPFITTIVDALSLLLYFQIASLLLGV